MEYYSYNHMNSDPWGDIKKSLADALRLLILIVAIIWGCSLLCSCSVNKTVATTETVHDTIKIVTRDSTDVSRLKTVYRDRFVDHYINQTFVITELGDTARTDRVEKVLINNSTIQHDSINFLKSKVDSLAQIKNKTLTVVKQKELGWWERTRLDTYYIILVALLACIAYIGFTIYRRLVR